jgi:hypothetical protein
MSTRRSILLCAPLALAFPACLGDPGTNVEMASRPSSVEPILVEGNPTCGDLGYGDVEFKIDPPASGIYDIGDGENTITITTDGVYVDWTATLGIDAVFVKGGPAGNLYLYDPEALSDTGLHSPDNASGGPAAISHISFCYDYELEVSKTAETSFDRSYEWTIDKSVDQNELTLSAGQSFLLGYAVQVSQTGSTDSNWAVEGEITVHNPSPFAANVTGVTDLIDDSIAASVECGVTFPYSLAAHDTLVCTYQADLSDGTTRTNVATATTAECEVEGGSGSASVDFTGVTPDAIDDCVDVSDTLAGALGTVCVGDAGLFEYDILIGPYAQCGTTHEVPNTASFLSNDTGANGDDSETVVVTIPACDVGCTLTQGYWKTHSSHGPAPYDDTWALLSSAGADTAFFSSGHSWYHIFWTAPAGNPYYILAHQYMAAVLNGLNGADLSAVQSSITAAESLFQNYSMAQFKTVVRSQALALAAILAAFNEGTSGPGHCSE